MTRLTRESGSLLRAYRARLSREETDTDAETRSHDMPSGPWLVDWIRIDGKWTIWKPGEEMTNGHGV